MYTRMPIIIVISSLVRHYFSRVQDAMVKGVQGENGTVLNYTVTISSYLPRYLPSLIECHWL